MALIKMSLIRKLIVTSFTYFICFFDVNSINKKSVVASFTCLISTLIGVVDFEAEADLGDRRVGLEVQKLLAKLFPRNRHLKTKFITKSCFCSTNCLSFLSGMQCCPATYVGLSTGLFTIVNLTIHRTKFWSIEQIFLINLFDVCNTHGLKSVCPT